MRLASSLTSTARMQSGMSADKKTTTYCTWFIKHWPKHPEWGDEENKRVQRKLFEQRETGIHYEDICSINPKEYGGNAKHIKRLLILAENGGYVCADYPAIGKTLIGIVKPNSKIQCNSDFHHIKRLKLDRSQDMIPPMRHRTLIGSPPYTTLCRWHIVGKRIECLVEGLQPEDKWSFLNPSEQEAICQEYLRDKYGLKYLLVSSGGNMKDIDILGITAEGTGIVAQVKYQMNENMITECVENLSTFPDFLRFVFCKKPSSLDEFVRKFSDRVEFVWTKKVQKWFDQQSAYRKNMFAFLETS